MDTPARPMAIPSGVIRTTSREASPGRWRIADKVRFRVGLPEKIGGWTKRSETQFSGLARGALCWNNNFGFGLYAFGTHTNFYVSDDDGIDFVDRTPTETTSFLTNVFSIAALGVTVTVVHTAHGRATGDFVLLRGAKHSGGGLLDNVDLDGIYEITVTDPNTYTFTHPTTADTMVASGGGRVYYVYNLADPFETTDGSSTVTVNQTAHGFVAGQTVEISNASAVGGLTLDGLYTIVSVVSADEYTIDAGANATATTTGGGKPIIEGLIQQGRSSTSTSTEEATTYGEGLYGSGPYGFLSGSSADPLYSDARTWSIDRWGEDLVACPIGGPIYYYDINRPGRMTPIAEAPQSVRFMFVTDERIMHALGLTDAPMTVAWSDQNDLTVWIADDENQANEGRVLRSGSRLIAGAPIGNGLNLLWTDTACYVHQYQGGALVYDTRKAPGGDDGGIIGPLGFVVGGANGRPVWMGPNGFRTFTGSVQTIQRSEEIEDFVYGMLNRSQQAKTCCMLNKQFAEAWWFYPSGEQSEPDRYVMVSLEDYSWVEGELSRTCGSAFDSGEQTTLWLGADGYVYEHESGVDADGEALTWRLRYSPFGDGNGEISIRHLDLDFERLIGVVDVAFSAYDREPGLDEDAPTETDTDALTYEDGDGSIDPRITGRYITLELSSDDVGNDFRLGVPKVAAKPKGRRR